MDRPDERPPSSPTTAAARRSIFGLGPRELGVAAIAVTILLSVGVWVRRDARRTTADVAVIRDQLAMRADALDVYREQFGRLQAEAAQARAWAESQSNESLRTWGRERARRAEAVVSAFSHEREAREFAATRKQVEQLVARGEVEAARARLMTLSAPRFPTPAELQRLKDRTYARPLAEFSRQNPEFYRAFRQSEPELAKTDEKALRAELAAAGGENVTPQTMLKVELLAAVAARDDPVVAEWSTLTSAMDYFESPDGETLTRWRRAQQALRHNDPAAATAEMQAILKSKVRTRQPFRAALGRALLKSRPDNPAEAYPFLAEAAAAGDKQARTWVAQEDLRQGRTAQARRWLEAAVADRDKDAIPLLVEAYRKQQDVSAAELAREAAVLERATDGPEPDPAALLLLGQLYERIDPPGAAQRAFAAFSRAAAKGSAAASAEVARRALAGNGTAENLDQAREEACLAFAAGEREPAAEVLTALMQRAPAPTAGAVQRLFERENATSGGGYMETRVVDGPGVTQLKLQVARYLDKAGMLGQAARYYARSTDPTAAQRHAELTASHPCDMCGGLGKVQVNASCPACGGKGRQICSFCGGTGFVFVPGSPPCGTCGGAGTIVQDRRVVSCATCGGTGKGKGSVVKQDCTHCDHGFIRCAECNGGVIKVTKECPDCHGRGTWTLVDRGNE